MIKGIGIDLVDINRMKKSMEKNSRFIKRILTTEEEEIFQHITATQRQAEFVAGRFAVKEAFAKALGTGIGKEISFQDISVTKSENGAPIVNVKNCEYKIWVSISHTESNAIAQIVLEE